MFKIKKYIDRQTDRQTNKTLNSQNQIKKMQTTDKQKN